MVNATNQPPTQSALPVSLKTNSVVSEPATAFYVKDGTQTTIPNPLVSPPKRSSRLPVLAGLLLMLILIGGLVAGWMYMNKTQDTRQKASQMGQINCGLCDINNDNTISANEITQLSQCIGAQIGETDGGFCFRDRIIRDPNGDGVLNSDDTLACTECLGSLEANGQAGSQTPTNTPPPTPTPNNLSACTLQFTVVAPTATPTLTPTSTVTPTVTPTSIPGATATPSPNVTPTITVVTPTPVITLTPVPVIGCNETCVTNADCSSSNHICFTDPEGVNRCRLETNPTDVNCQPLVTQQPPVELPQELPQSGPAEWLTWMKAGLAVLGIGAALLLML